MGSAGKVAMKWGLTFTVCRGKSQVRDGILATGAGASRPGLGIFEVIFFFSGSTFLLVVIIK